MNTLYLAFRVSASVKGKNSTPAVKVAVAAVALSVAVMLAATAIVLGFKDEITKKVLGFNPHIVLKANPSLSHDEYLADLTPTLQTILDETPYITQYSLGASVPAIFKTPTDFKGTYLRSANDDKIYDFLDSQLVSGEIPDFNTFRDKILISSIAADQLMVGAGDTLPAYFITDEIVIRPLIITGVYNSHFSTYDDIYSFGSLPFIQGIGKTGENEGTHINIYVDDFERLQEYALDLRQRLDKAYATGLIYRYYDMETALNSGANFFSWLALLDTNVTVILVLMTVVALITLISGMMILIVDKQRFILIMKALGAPNRMIEKVFVWLTLRVALTGLVIGNIIIISLLLVQERYHIIPLDPDSYYIDFVPVQINAWGIMILNVAILLITYLMLLLPARFAGRIKLSSH